MDIVLDYWQLWRDFSLKQKLKKNWNDFMQMWNGIKLKVILWADTIE